MTGVDRSTLPVPGPSGRFHFPAIHRGVLASGLELRAVSHFNVPISSVALLMPGGTASDPATRPGLAAFTADLLDEGSGGRSALEVSDALARLGADLDVDVGADAIIVAITTLSRFRDAALALLAEMVIQPNLAEPDVERVRKLRLERMKQLRDHAPAVAEQVLARVLYRDHPYGHLSLGTEPALESTTVDEVREFHRRAFVPQGATLVVVGDADPSELIGAAERVFTSWQAARDGPVLDRAAGTAPPPSEPQYRVALVPRPGAAQSELRIGHVCAARNTPDYHTLVVLNTILGGQFVSRINMNLRQDKGYTYGARTGFDLRLGLGPFVLQTSVQTEATAPAIRESLREIEDIRGPRPATADELTLARASVTLGYPRGFETAQQVARGVAQLALHGLPDTYFEEFVPRVEAVTLDDVTRAAEKYLDTSRMTTLVVGDKDSVAASLESLGLGEPVTLSDWVNG